jgi:light-regulated signal transduction histidine kinase (bacteriophytochrome)
MQIRDIVNREIVNLTNCDQEPIHIPGSIQEHGFLIALNENLVTCYVSGNVEKFTGLSYQQVLDKPFSQLLNDQIPAFEHYIKNQQNTVTPPLPVSLQGKLFNISVHESGTYLIVEFEPVVESSPLINTVYDQTVQFLKYMQEARSLKSLCQKVAEEIRALTGYDRVMIYRFDKDYNGEVYAESLDDRFEPFLGLHYPHTDIPVQARQLYIRNLLRIIVDVNYSPVPIYTIEAADAPPLDLSLSVLRSTSPIHVQYLQNMGVGATLTISLLHEGKLWGLIACHHYSPKYIDHYTRISAQLQGHFLTSQIHIRMQAEEYEISKNTGIALDVMLERSYSPTRESIRQIVSEPELLHLCNAAGVCILLDAVVYKSGNTPSDENILAIASWAHKHTGSKFFSTSKLIEQFPEAEKSCQHAAGILFYTLKSFENSCIIWFNPETLDEVQWGGDPNKAIEKSKGGLSPRKSFEAWREVVKCTSREWRTPELHAAANYAYALQQHVTFILLNEEEQRQRILTRKLQESNAELENINWISTHDLKEPLRKIQVFSSRLLMKTDGLSDDVGSTLHKMSESASRMQKLIESLALYARTRQNDEVFSVVNLNLLMESVVKDLCEEGMEGNPVITIMELPEIKGISILIRQLFVNLISNSIKFARKDLTPEINISYGGLSKFENEQDVRFHKIILSDNGIGFDPVQNANIFKLFTRLHTVKEYDGSGMGLALCKKIMQLHDGFIHGEGEPGKGANFFLYFPETSLNEKVTGNP